MKKFLSLATAFVILASSVFTAPVSAITFKPGETIHSEAACLVSLDTGDIIFEQCAEEKKYPASLTKIMTAILVLESIDDLDNTVITAPGYIFDELYEIGGASTADFRRNEEATAKDLMYGMMLQSACEAASILADYVGGGSVSNFVDMMNSKAAELGCTNTHFTNAHGLFNENQYTTARDMAIIAEYAVGLPHFMEICNTYTYELPATNKHSEPRTVVHTNKLLSKNSDYYYEFARGVKTGTLDECGKNLVSTASKDGYNYLLVTLGAPQKDEEGNTQNYQFEDAKILYEWAFKYFSYTTLINPEEEIDEVPVEFSDSNDYVLVYPAEEYTMLWPSSVDVSNIIREVHLFENVAAPVTVGQKLGTVDLIVQGEKLTTINLVTKDEIKRSEMKYNIFLVKNFFVSPWFKTAIVITVAAVLIYVILFLTVTRKKRRKMKRVNKTRRF